MNILPPPFKKKRKSFTSISTAPLETSQEQKPSKITIEEENSFACSTKAYEQHLANDPSGASTSRLLEHRRVGPVLGCFLAESFACYPFLSFLLRDYGMGKKGELSHGIGVFFGWASLTARQTGYGDGRGVEWRFRLIFGLTFKCTVQKICCTCF